jgi:hypothetical protein
MRSSEGRELPPDLARVYRAAVRIEWLTIAYMLSAVALLYLTLGRSQAMKAGVVGLADDRGAGRAARIRFTSSSTWFRSLKHGNTTDTSIGSWSRRTRRLLSTSRSAWP